MEYYAGGNLGRTILIRFDKGDLLLEGIQEVVDKEDIKSGVIVSGIGTFEYCIMHMITTTGYPGHDEFVTIEGPLELLSVSGLVADGKPHLHITVSDTEKAYGGHLEPGSRVCYLAEICLVELPDANLTRIAHPSTGTMQLKQG
jgi:predicted DNA-binding protein with PD1-like motif